MIGLNERTDFESHSTVELEEFIRENRHFTKPALSATESEFEKAVREKSKRTRNSEIAAKKQSEVSVELLQDQQAALQGILSELARPWYKTANGWFSFIAMIAAVVGALVITM